MPRISTPYIMDIEASGFGPDSYPIEIGVALADGARFCSLIVPAADWTHWDDSAQGVHNISRDMLKRHGSHVHQVASELNEMLAGKTVYSDGWVVDKPWLLRLFQAAGVNMSFQLSPIEMIMTEPQILLWDDTKARLTEEANLQRHRASNDAWLIQETYRHTNEALDATLTG
ncbi:MAG: hypothetical protein VYB48_02900 [Pseudomonadota bacterium]|nr:hypothetical protein [Pseudomonadota bacterium]MEC8103687.1 hypothetical protein [Pseudomonadota bacterium]